MFLPPRPPGMIVRIQAIDLGKGALFAKPLHLLHPFGQSHSGKPRRRGGQHRSVNLNFRLQKWCLHDKGIRINAIAEDFDRQVVVSCLQIVIQRPLIHAGKPVSGPGWTIASMPTITPHPITIRGGDPQHGPRSLTVSSPAGVKPHHLIPNVTTLSGPGRKGLIKLGTRHIKLYNLLG